jgi:hypothetical protein
MNIDLAREWIESHDDLWESHAVSLLESGSSHDTDKPSMYAYLISSSRIGSIFLWDSGECELESLDIGTNKQVLSEHREVENMLDFENALRRLIDVIADN